MTDKNTTDKNTTGPLFQWPKQTPRERPFNPRRATWSQKRNALGRIEPVGS